MAHPLGTLLQQEHMLKDKDLERVERICREQNCSFEEAVARLDLLTPETLQAFKEHLPTLALSQLTDVDPNILDLLPEELAHRYQCVPVASIGGTLTLAMSDPSDKATLEELQSRLGRPVDAVPALEADLAQVISTHYGDGMEDPPTEGDDPPVPDPTPQPPAEPETVSELHPDHTRADVVMEGPGDQPEQVVLANRLLALMAVRKADRVEVRWKGDTQSSAYLFDTEGRHGLAAIPVLRAQQVIQRYRVLADLLMASRKRPQKGSFSVKMKYEDGTIEDRAFHIEIVPIEELEGEVATLTFEEAEHKPAHGAAMAPDAPPQDCPACGETVIRAGFSYCPMCGVGIA